GFYILQDIRCHGVVGLDVKPQDIVIADRVHNGVGVKSRTKDLLSGLWYCKYVVALVLIFNCVEDRRTGKAEHRGFRIALSNALVHRAELAAMTLIKDKDHVLVIDIQDFFITSEMVELLNRGDDNLTFIIEELTTQDFR